VVADGQVYFAASIFAFMGTYVYALDAGTGAVVWKTEFEAGATGAPMTYMHQGKQYIVFAIGGQQHPAEFIALALP